MSVTIEEAQKSLPELIAGLKPGEEIVITQGIRPVAQMVSFRGSGPDPQPTSEPRFGSCRGKLIVISEDDEHLRDFAEYMP